MIRKFIMVQTTALGLIFATSAGASAAWYDICSYLPAGVSCVTEATAGRNVADPSDRDGPSAAPSRTSAPDRTASSDSDDGDQGKGKGRGKGKGKGKGPK